MANLPVQTTSPINWQTPIVNPDGTMTEPFRRLLQALKTNSGDSNDVVQQLVDAQLQAGLGIEITPDGHLLSGPTIAANIQTLLDSISDTQGDILYRSGSAWTFLPPGTSGNVLQTNGPGADPTWVPQSGGGSAAWTLVNQSGAPATGATWTYSSAVAAVDVVNLGSYNELLLVARNVTVSTSGIRTINVSVDNGSTFYNTSGDYSYITNTGTETATAVMMSHGTASASARTLIGHIFNLKGPIKASQCNNDTLHRIFTGSSSDINAIRFSNNGSGNLTGGSLYVYVR